MTLPPADCLRRWSSLPARPIRTALLCTMAPSLAAMPAFILAGRITIVQQLVGFSGSIWCNSKERRRHPDGLVNAFDAFRRHRFVSSTTVRTGDDDALQALRRCGILHRLR